MSPLPDDTSTLNQREPAVLIITAAIVLLNAVLTVVFQFVELTAGQVAAIYGVTNPLGAFAAAVFVRGKVAPWEPVEHPVHAADHGYDPDPTGL